MAKYLKKLTDLDLVIRSVDTKTYPPAVTYKRAPLKWPVATPAEVKEYLKKEPEEFDKIWKTISKEKDTMKKESVKGLMVKIFISKILARALLHVIIAAEKESKAGKDYLSTAIEIDVAPTLELLLSLVSRPRVLLVAKSVLNQYAMQLFLDKGRMHRFVEKSKAGEKHVK